MFSARRYIAVALMVLTTGGVLALPARAQLDDVVMGVPQHRIGFEGVLRPGTWAPLMVMLENQSTQVRQVHCEWIVPDSDNDLVQYRRSNVVLNPQRVTPAWLYAMPRMGTTRRSLWRIRVIDADSGELVTTQLIAPGQVLQSDVSAIGVVGNANMGLERYATDVTQHEKIRFIRGMDATRLPDRPHGLDMLESIIWTPQGPGPLEPGVALDTVRQWIRRGGHLVIVMAAVGDVWNDPQLADLTPAVKSETVPDVPSTQLLGVLGDGVLPPGMPPVTIRTFVPSVTQQNVSVLMRDGKDRPVIVAGDYGLGRVTMIGIDLTDPQLSRLGMPIGKTFWQTVFGWRSPAMPAKEINNRLNKNETGGIIDPQYRAVAELGSFVPGQIAMSGTAAGALLVAIILFGVYWLAAGPVAYGVLKNRGMVQHSWVVFVGVVVLFSIVTWSMAFALRPIRTRIAHFSVVDVDMGDRLMKTHSWMSLFVPRHGQVAVSIAEQSDETEGGTSQPAIRGNTIASPGLGLDQAQTTGFIDPQRYLVDAADPSSVMAPMRSTAKQFELNYAGAIDRGAGVEGDAPMAWVLPEEEVKVALVNGLPQGELKHRLPGVLRDVFIVFAPGGGHPPMLWQDANRREWPPNTVLSVSPPPDLSPPPKVTHDYLLVRSAADYFEPRQWKDEGYLGKVMQTYAGENIAEQQEPTVRVPRNRIVTMTNLLTFYNMLPPPDFAYHEKSGSFWRRGVNYHRTVGRAFDLTEALALPRLVVMGHLEGSPIPLPLRVDDQRIDNFDEKSWTMVRWRFPLD